MNKNRLYALFLLLIFLLLSACGSKEIELSPVPSDGVILAFGDSLTFGTGAPPGQSYPEVLQALIKRKIVNAGVPGETSEQGLRRLPQVLADNRPRLVILCHGGNDMLRKMDQEATAANLRGMIKMVRDRNAEVVLIAVPRPGLILSPAPFYKKISEEMKVPLENEILKVILGDGGLKADYIHPNAEGYAKFASAIQALLKKHGALN